MPSKPGFKLVESDLPILESVYRCRIAHIAHLAALTGRSRRPLNLRLIKLTERGYLSRHRFHTDEKYLYAVGAKALPILDTEGVPIRKGAEHRPSRLRERTERYRTHDLMAVDVFVALELRCRSGSTRLHAWEPEGKDVYDTVTVFQNAGSKRMPIQPDGLITLEDSSEDPDRPSGSNRFDFYLEVVNKSKTDDFVEKLDAYRHYFERGCPRMRTVRSSRVLTITNTGKRAVSLCEAVRDVLPRRVRKFYYFAPITRFRPPDIEDVLEPIFMTPADYETGKRYRLIPPLARRPSDF